MTRSVKLVTTWVLQFLLAALFLVQGVTKLAGTPAWISRFKLWGYPDHFYLAVGLAEVVGGVLLLIPRLTRSGAILLMLIMAGATGTHLINHESQFRTTLVLLALLGVVVYMRRSLRGALAVAP